MSTAYDHWKTTDYDGEAEDRDYEQFQAWSQGFDDATLGSYARDYFDSPQIARLSDCNGWRAFEAWLFEHRWADARDAMRDVS